MPWRFSALEEDTRSSRMAISNQGEMITPQLYARCYRLCRDAIHSLPGHADDQVLVGGVAPWNNLTKYDGNPTGDWVQYFGDILKLLGPQNCDGFTVHTYTHSPNPAEIYTDQFMNPPFHKQQYNFRTYRDFMNAVPASMRHLPAYITETDQDVPWMDENNGWVKRAYGEIDAWNKQPGNQQIRALILYRWPRIDRWVIEGKQGVIQDFREAMRNDYQWKAMPEQSKPEPAARLQRRPDGVHGQRGQPAADARRCGQTAGRREGQDRARNRHAQSSAARRWPMGWTGGRCAAPLMASSTRAGWPRPHQPAASCSPPRSRPSREPQTRSLNPSPSRSRNPWLPAAIQGRRQGQDRRSPTCAARQATGTSRPTTSCTRSRPTRSCHPRRPEDRRRPDLVGCALYEQPGQHLFGLGGRRQGVGRPLLVTTPVEPTTEPPPVPPAPSRQPHRRPNRQPPPPHRSRSLGDKVIASRGVELRRSPAADRSRPTT